MGPEDLSEQDWQAIADMADAYQNDSISRRDALKLASAGGIGALMMGGGMQAVGTAEAANNEVGQIGTAAEPVDVEADDINAVEGVIDSLSGTSLQYESVNAGEINEIRYLDPTTNDMAADLNAEIAAASAGDVIVVPPGDYHGGEQVVIDKEVIITGHPVDHSRSRESSPANIDFSASFTGPPILATAQAVVSHLEVKNTGATKEAGLRAHAQFTAHSLKLDGDFTYGLHLHERAASGDNLNGSYIDGFCCYGTLNTTHGIFLETEENSNIQPNKIHAQDILNTQYGIVNQGRGGSIELVHFDPLEWRDSTSQTTIAVIDGNVYNNYTIDYTELVDIVVSVQNFGQVANPGGWGEYHFGDVDRDVPILVDHNTLNESVYFHQGAVVLLDVNETSRLNANGASFNEVTYNTPAPSDVRPDGATVSNGTSGSLISLRGPHTFALVSGVMTGAVGRNFLDVVLGSADAEIASKQFGIDANNPGTRTYDVDINGDLVLSLADDGAVTADYSVSVLSTEMMSQY